MPQFICGFLFRVANFLIDIIDLLNYSVQFSPLWLAFLNRPQFFQRIFHFYQKIFEKFIGISSTSACLGSVVEDLILFERVVLTCIFMCFCVSML